jgi:hypothetical protein
MAAILTPPKLPRADFPLRPHRNGQWYKSVWNSRTRKTEQFYFGSWHDDRKGERALKDPQIGWLARRDAIKAGVDNPRVEPVSGSDMALGDGNAQGYAVGRQVAVSPVAFMSHRTLMHELGHVVLGHTRESQRMEDDNSTTPRDLREVEAECVALICCSSLGLGGEEFSRGYIQHWFKGQMIPERSAQKIFKVADQILRAGRNDRDIAASSKTT